MSTETELALYICPDYTMLPILTKLIDGYIKRQVVQRFPYLEETANHRSCLLQSKTDGSRKPASVLDGL